MAKMKKCKTCSKEIAINAKLCPECGDRNKKPIYKRAWFMVLAFILVLGAMGSPDSEDSTVSDTTKEEITQNQDEEVAVSKEEEEVKEEPKEEAKEEDNVPTEHKSALKKAQIYIDTMHMSKAGLYEQLTSEYGEQFEEEAAQYAIDNVEANWNENALKKAQVYQQEMAMSKDAIYDQLISEYGEEFTKEQAQYAIDNLE